MLDLPTAYWHEMLGLWRTRDEIEFPTQIRLVIIGGERAQDSSLRIWKQKATDGIILQNTYGPTETTVVATAANLARRERPTDTREVEIGRPIAGAHIYVLNRQGQPAIPGVHGEICIGGSGVARGYLSRPDLTAERFLPDPFGGSGTRLYRTGDFGRFRSNGNLEFLGRSDQQIKIRGYRVEIGEIEAALRKHPAVKQALIVLRDDYKQEPQLVAYYVQQEPQPTTAEALRAYLFEQLPEYMVPAMLVPVEFIPLTPHGKVDIKALPVPQYLQPEDYVAPRTGLEGLIAEIWAYLLGIPRVSIRDNFFTLGGHSLLAMRALSRIREITQAEIPIQYFFDHPTIAALAARLDATQGAVGDQPPLVKRRAGGGRIPLSYAQERLWFLQEFEGGSVYNLPLAFRFHGPLDRQLLEQALQTLVQRHESLRTHFAESSAGVEQVVSKTMDWKLSYVDLFKEKFSRKKKRSSERRRSAG